MKDWNPKVSGLMVLGRNGCLADFAMQGDNARILAHFRIPALT